MNDAGSAAQAKLLGRRIVAGILPAAVVAAAVVTGPSAGATVRPTGRHDRAQLTREIRAMRGLPGRPASLPGQLIRTARSGWDRASLASPTVTSKVNGPALVYTDWSFTGPVPVTRDLATGGGTTAGGSPGPCLLDPRWSPDGTTEVVIRTLGGDVSQCDGPTSVLEEISVNGTVTTLTTAPANAFFELPNWSPDGSTILYTLLQDDIAGNFVSSDLYTIPAVGGSPTAVGGAGVNAWDGVYSPDGLKIVAATDYSLMTANYLGIMNADGSNPVILTGTELSVFSPDLPAWSPDGSKLSFRYDKDAGSVHNFGIAVINADDTGEHILPVTASASTWAGISSWSADGSEQYYSAGTRSTSTGVFSSPPSIYGTDTGGTYRTTVVAGSVFDFLYDPFFVGPGPGTGSASTFTPVDPTRVQARQQVAGGGSLDIQVAGAGLPAPIGATAVTLNLTGVGPTAPAYLSVYPRPDSGNAVPLVSNVNLVRGQVAAVAAQVSLPASGFIRVHNTSTGPVGVIVDVTGYFSAGLGAAGYDPLPVPARAFDGTIGQGLSHTVDLSAMAPPGAVAAVVNLTGARPSASTYLAVTPDAVPPGGAPTVSTLNLSAGTTRANLATVQLSGTGTVSVYNRAGSTRAVLDVEGFYTTEAGHLAYYPLAPTRVLDTRVATNTWMGSTSPIQANRTYNVQLGQTTTTTTGIITVPANAQAVVFGLTAVGPSAGTYLTVYPDPPANARPGTSNLNAAVGTIVANLVVTALPADRLVGIYNAAGKTAVIADLNGYYA